MTSTAAGEPARPEAGGPGGPFPYRERLWPAPWIWVTGILLAALVSLIAIPFGAATAVVVSAVALVVVVALLVAWCPVIEVRGDELLAGRAHVPVRLLGEVTALDAAAMRHELGRGLDVRAFICIRGWIGRGVRVALNDPDDPTPYWLLSSRRPERLATALGRVRTEG